MIYWWIENGIFDEFWVRDPHHDQQNNFYVD